VEIACNAAYLEWLRPCEFVQSDGSCFDFERPLGAISRRLAACQISTQKERRWRDDDEQLDRSYVAVMFGAVEVCVCVWNGVRSEWLVLIEAR